MTKPINLETTLDSLEGLHKAANGRGNTAHIPKDLLGQLLRDHHKMFTRLGDVNDKPVCLSKE